MLISDKRVVICTLILLVLLLVSLFAYLIIPDKTENANRQISQIALSSPLSTFKFIVKERQTKKRNKNFFQTLISGEQDRHEYIPYDEIDLSVSQVSSIFQNVIRLHEESPKEIKGISNFKRTFLFGTDKYGRDVFSRIILGLRISLIIGLFSVLLSLLIGITMGSIAGYFGGRVDQFIMLIINSSWSIPTVLMAFAVIIALGKGFLVIILAIGLTMWVDVARIVRGQVMQVKEELYIRASKVLGFSHYRILVKHVLPNIMGSILVMAAANFATAILVEAGLSYLGLGIQPPTPSLGNLLQESYAYATGGFVYLSFFPIATIMLLVLSFNVLGTSLRDVFDIKGVEK